MSDNQSVTIVMIEDDEGHARLIERNIRRAGISNTIRHFTDGASGLEYLLLGKDGPVKNGPALVLLDLNLPRLDGREVMQALRADPATSTLLVVALTSSADPEEVAACYALGVNSYIQKPVDFPRFVRAMQQLGLYWQVLNQPPSS